MKKIYIHILFILLAKIGFSQVVSTSAVLDTNAILIGEQTNLTLSIDYNVADTAVQIQFPQIKDTLTKQIEVVKKSVLDTLIPDRDEPTIFRQTQTLTITAFDSGYFVIPAFQFIVNKDTVLSEPTLLSVFNVPVDTSQAIFDIKGPIAEPFNLIDWLKQNWWWLLLTLIGITAIVFAIKYFKNKPAKVIVKKPKPVIPAHVTALKKLKKIKQQKLWKKGKPKQHHSKISEALRAYLEDRYNINALEQTTEEITHSLRIKDINKSNTNTLIEILKLADLVKYAKEKTLQSEDEDGLEKAFEFVNQTKEISTEETKNV